MMSAEQYQTKMVTSIDFRLKHYEDMLEAMIKQRDELATKPATDHNAKMYDQVLESIKTVKDEIRIIRQQI